LSGRAFFTPKDLPQRSVIPGVRLFNSTPTYFDQANEVNNPNAKTFAEVGVSESRLKSLKAAGLEKMFPIQEQTYGPIREGRDVVARAKTGSGKTLAFTIPLVERHEGESSGERGSPSIVVLAPTRELALQVHGEITKTSPRMKCVCVYGGQSVGIQARALQSNVEVVVGTPGRMIHFINEGILNLNNVKSFVLDEADQMLDIGFKADIEEIMGYMPNEKQTLLFSATMPSWIRSITSEYMKDPHFVDLIGNQLTPSEVTHGFIRLQLPSQRLVALSQLIAKHRDGKMLIFVDTKTECAQLSSHPMVALRAVRTLHGDINQQDRAAILDSFRSGTCKILIATDVAARGLDIPGVDVVVHYRPTKRIDSYIHRSGRCGRAGNKGTSICLIAPEDTHLIRSIEKTIKSELVEFPLPTNEDIHQVNMSSVLSMLTSTPETSLQNYIPQANELLEKEEGPRLFAAALSVLAGKSSAGDFSLLTGMNGFATIEVYNQNGSPIGKYPAIRYIRTVDESINIGASYPTMAGSVVLDVPSSSLPALLEAVPEFRNSPLVRLLKEIPELDLQGSSYQRGGSRDHVQSPHLQSQRGYIRDSPRGGDRDSPRGGDRGYSSRDGYGGNRNYVRDTPRPMHRGGDRGYSRDGYSNRGRSQRDDRDRQAASRFDNLFPFN